MARWIYWQNRQLKTSGLYGAEGAGAQRKNILDFFCCIRPCSRSDECGGGSANLRRSFHSVLCPGIQWFLTGLKDTATTSYIKNELKEKGEWFWGIDAEGKVLKKEGKIGLWKCPYHHTRTCMEALQRIKKIYNYLFHTLSIVCKPAVWR